MLKECTYLYVMMLEVVKFIHRAISPFAISTFIRLIGISNVNALEHIFMFDQKYLMIHI